ncbi:hypothetical protein JXM67_09135 [candidate division WOR-3 bacterium]|nr:hypothetical protein [candidate division WOR-3 bacterium]
MKKTLITTILAVFVLVTSAVAQPTEVWNKTYDSGSDDLARGIAADDAGNSYVTGTSGYNDCQTIKYDSNGNILWNEIYDSGYTEMAFDVALDGEGNVYITGCTNDYPKTENKFLTVKYDNDGTELWAKTLGGITSCVARGIAVDAAGFVYVTGYQENFLQASEDFYTIKYDTDGNLIWMQSYGVTYGSREKAYDVALDASGNVYVTGRHFNGDDWDVLTVKYDNDGNLQWGVFHDENNDDGGFGIAVDADTNVYVTGYSSNNIGNFDYLTIKYDKDGNMQWKRFYNVFTEDAAQAVAVDDSYVYVTGYCESRGDQIFLTLCYAENGDFMWEKIFNSIYCDFASAIAVDASHNLYVTGSTNDWVDYDFRTIKYSQAFSSPAVAESTPSSHSPVNLEVSSELSSTPTIRYSIPDGLHGTLTLYSVDGRTVDEISVNSSSSSVTWDAGDIPAGAYIAVLRSGILSARTKFVLTK